MRAVRKNIVKMNVQGKKRSAPKMRNVIDRHVIIIDVPHGWCPGRGDIEMITDMSSQAVEAYILTLTRPGQVEDVYPKDEPFSNHPEQKIVLQPGEWKPWTNSIYGRMDVEEMQRMIDRLTETARALQKEIILVAKGNPGSIYHWMQVEDQARRG